MIPSISLQPNLFLLISAHNSQHVLVREVEKSNSFASGRHGCKASSKALEYERRVHSEKDLDRGVINAEAVLQNDWML